MYANSLSHFIKASNLIPTASQTFSKSHYCLPVGAAPLFVESGNGAYITDVDGNQYIDLVNGLLSVSLGYQHPVVNQAVVEQLGKGISFSLPTRLEYQLAERMVDDIPCAEMVRFGKNGTDVTSAGVRLARAITVKSRVAVCGYHGWQDWYIGSTSRNLGVPHEVSALTSTFEFNKPESLEVLFDQFPGEFAVVVMEQMNVEKPNPDFLPRIRELCDQNNCLLMFDEIITGYRFNIGGAQSEFGVIPDLATFGKGMGNGLPVSALAGKKEYMLRMDDIFFSGTFGGEALSLSAAIAVHDYMKENHTPEKLAESGEKLTQAVMAAADETGASEWFSLVGHDCWKIWSFDDADFLRRSVLTQELASHGVLTTGSHNMSEAISDNDIEKISQAYYQAFEKMSHADDLSTIMQGELIKPIFRVRGK